MKLPKGARFDLKTGSWSIPQHAQMGRRLIGGPTGPDAWFSNDGGRSHTQIPSDSVEVGGINFLDPPATLKDRQRGGVLAPLLEGELADGSSNLKMQGGVPDEVVRQALLFTDRLEVPLVTGGGVKIRSVNLTIEDVLYEHRVKPMIAGFDAAQLSFSIWQRQEQVDPGRWTIWHAPDVEPIPKALQEPDLALRLRLQNAVIVPHRDVSIDDVLNFKEARRAELQALHVHLEEIALKVARSGGDPREARHEVEKLQAALENYLRVARDANWRKAIAGLDMKFNLGEAAKSAWVAFPTAIAAMQIHSPILAGLAVAGQVVMGGLTIEKAIGFKATTPPLPFSYIAHIEKDL